MIMTVIPGGKFVLRETNSCIISWFCEHSLASYAVLMRNSLCYNIMCHGIAAPMLLTVTTPSNVDLNKSSGNAESPEKSTENRLKSGTPKRCYYINHTVDIVAYQPSTVLLMPSPH